MPRWPIRGILYLPLFLLTWGFSFLIIVIIAFAILFVLSPPLFLFALFIWRKITFWPEIVVIFLLASGTSVVLALFATNAGRRRKKKAGTVAPASARQNCATPPSTKSSIPVM
jgi:type VI protein secretion system component VasK